MDFGLNGDVTTQEIGIAHVELRHEIVEARSMRILGNRTHIDAVGIEIIARASTKIAGCIRTVGDVLIVEYAYHHPVIEEEITSLGCQT